MTNLSLIIPVCNDERNIYDLYMDIKDAFHERLERYEIIFVNDGSKDGSDRVLREIVQIDPCVRRISLDRTYGKSAAIQAGILHSSYPLIALMDASMQTHPKDIFKLMPFIRRKDFVNGRWRTCDDKFLNKVSMDLGSRIRCWITGHKNIDSICPLQLFKREVADRLFFFNGIDRFLPVMARIHGFSVIEVTVERNRARSSTQRRFFHNICAGVMDAIVVALLKTRVIRYKTKSG